MKKNQLMKWILMPALAASVAVGGVGGIVPSFSPTNVAYAASTAQTQLNQFAKHYATFYKQYEKKSESIENKLDKATEQNWDAVLDEYDAFLTEFDTFLETNYTYGSQFNTDLKEIEALFYDILLTEYNMEVTILNYYAGNLTDGEYVNEFMTELGDYVELHEEFYAQLESYKSKHKITFTADLLYLLGEEASEKPVTKPVTTTSTHTVKKGDTLYSIAKKYNMTVTELKQLNNLKKETISVGQKLKVKKDASVKPTTPTETKTTTKVVTASSLNARSAASTNSKILGSLKKNAKVEVVSTSGDWAKIKYGKGFAYVSSKYLKDEPKKTTTPVTTPAKNAKTHTVKKGDTLYKISQTYNVTVANLKNWNGLKNDNIKVGQKLKLSK